MIKKTGETYMPMCDGCEEELPEEWDFHDAVGAMKAKGWRLVPPSPGSKTWLHLCPGCAWGV